MTERADLAKAWDDGYRHGRAAYANRHTATEGARANPYLQAGTIPPTCDATWDTPNTNHQHQCADTPGHMTNPHAAHYHQCGQCDWTATHPAGHLPAPTPPPRSSGIIRNRTHGSNGPDAA